MNKYKIKGGTIEPHEGRNVDTAPEILKRCDDGKPIFLSERKIRLHGIRNIKNAPQLANNYHDTSTLSAIKKETVKIILPYEANSRRLTDVSRTTWSWVNPNEDLSDNRVNLDIKERWEYLNSKNEKDGVYSKQREKLFLREGKKSIGLNDDMNRKQAKECPLVRIKFGHPNEVDSKFAINEEEFNYIIDKTFELGKQKTMMGQYLPKVSDKGLLSAWYVSRLYDRAWSYAWTDLDYNNGRFALYSVGDATLITDEAMSQLESLEKVVNQDNFSTSAIRKAITERDELKEKQLTTDQIYSAISGQIGSDNKRAVREILDNLPSQ